MKEPVAEPIKSPKKVAIRFLASASSVPFASAIESPIDLPPRFGGKDEIAAKQLQ